MGRTLYDKLWESHVIRAYDDGSALLYVDRHLLHEVSTPQSFIAIEKKNRAVRRPDANLAVPDHVVSTTNRQLPIADPLARGVESAEYQGVGMARRRGREIENDVAGGIEGDATSARERQNMADHRFCDDPIRFIDVEVLRG